MRILDRLISQTLPLVPRFFVRWVAGRYIAGETVGDAIATGKRLNALGATATFDLLGEELADPGRCRETAERYVNLLRALDDAGVRSGVSVKLTALGLRIDKETARQNLRTILEAARSSNRFVRIDMEDATTTDAALEIYRSFREEGHDRLGVVLQSALRRTHGDAVALARTGADVRIVKGIYIEREEIAYRDPEVIRRNYARVLRVLLREGCRVGVATHDDRLLFEMEAALSDLSLPRDALEIQMLLGVREHLRDIYLGLGYRVRVYVPFGERWYEYSVRRLRENPAIAGHVTRQLWGRIFKRKRDG
jgi:proline dehydrogenase